jgi:hypothetical protein
MLSGNGECWGGLDIHHIDTRGSGGGDTIDNVILLCRRHHTLAQSGKPSKEYLHQRLKEFYLRLTIAPW